MALEKSRIDELLVGINDLSVEARLNSINQAMDTFNQLFTEDLTIPQLAQHVMYVESLYNRVREELKQSFKIMIPEEVEESITREQAKKAKAKKESENKKKGKKSKVPAFQDPELIASMQSMFLSGELKKREPAGGEVGKPPPPVEQPLDLDSLD